MTDAIKALLALVADHPEGLPTSGLVTNENLPFSLQEVLDAYEAVKEQGLVRLANTPTGQVLFLAGSAKPTARPDSDITGAHRPAGPRSSWSLPDDWTSPAQEGETTIQRLLPRRLVPDA